jgi:CRP-like cAMP-binding protein
MSAGNILEMVDIFQDLNQAQLAQIYSICEERLYKRGAMIVKENAPSKEFYIILEGEVEILVSPEKLPSEAETRQPRRIAYLDKGGSFGEVALVDEGLRSASARCASDTCRVLVLDRDRLMKLLKQDLEMGFVVIYNLAADLCLKIRQTTYLVRENLLYSPKKEA